ncbi:prepilin peptidase [Sinorhizobium sp. RAC02]|uniref:A24 family peptidase n=1 Tax=Sinorhizobium sp. RAC02 TaxID=1842534 RepID=UPI00083D776F|nr:prepilin peptidase [Sinorhizobium sp. RAC02]AOF90443.1 type IV leader peptidase family protein [Sinorhizobium sp. RAC02]
MTQALIFVVFPLCLALAAFSDLFTMTIPNRVPAILLAAFVIVAPLAGLGLTDIAMHLAAGLLVFAACFTLFAFNIMGGGDAKLLTASAVWFGLSMSLLEFLVCVSFFGGVLTLGILVLRSNANAILASRLPVPNHLLEGRKVPYGIAIGAAAFATYASSPLMIAALGKLG